MKYYRILYKIGRKKDYYILQAENRADAINKFLSLGIGVLIEITQISEPLSIKLERLKKRLTNPIKNRSVNLEHYIALLEQLSVMLDAGLPLNFALSEVIKNEKDPMLKAIFSQIADDIESGKSLYEAAKRYKIQLGTLSLSLFRLGEETGNLAEEIGHLAKVMQEILDNRRKFKKATRYPIFIIIAMIIAFVVVTILVIPQFEAFFKESDMELPLPTQFLLWFEHALIDYGPYILIGALGMSGVLGYLYKNNEKVRLLLDKILLKIFIIGNAIYYAMMSRFTYIFQVLNDAGVPLIDSIKIALEIVENSYLRSKLSKIVESIEEGKSLYQGFAQTELFENMVIEMIRSGEIGGGMSRMFQKINKIYKDRFDYMVDNIAVLIEPLLIAAIAGFVLTLALGIFLPMWNLTQVSG
ncbi:type II secretion system F family protein [Nitratiruptor sp. YY09-18]|uniref:type II secretion system F family protein n=1 Tax=Nitratiruptor sp. YY09-18 TaxID=2724901 RepID=UPI0019166EAC|nr:type II secretion system F family protein [Nitratiruptor sp. YY09-18]BCD68668.1 general secretion pathway protein F [Nitratiruptor sp. YY09-18]